MTDKQQIEETLKLDIEECAGFYSAFINDMRISKNKPLSVSKTIMSFDCPKDYILQALGLPKNAVVLTREEFDRMNSCIKSEEEVRAIIEQQMLPMVRELTDKEVGKKLATVTALVCSETAKELAETLISVLWEEEKDETIRIKDVRRVICDVVRSKYNVEVQDNV